MTPSNVTIAKSRARKIIQTLEECNDKDELTPAIVTNAKAYWLATFESYAKSLTEDHEEPISEPVSDATTDVVELPTQSHSRLRWVLVTMFLALIVAVFAGLAGLKVAS